jgi:hypothetical protein
LTAIGRIFRQIDRLLRGRTATDARQPVLFLLTLGITAGMAYGAVMGAFALRPTQMLYAAIKVPMLLGAAFLVSLPSFFTFNTLLGLRGDFGRTMAALLVAQTTFTLTLLSLAPVTAFWYLSSTDYQSAVLFNGLMFAIATVAARFMLYRFYRPLIAAEPRHAWVLRGWLITFTFVAIQMAWVLRPFVGSPFAATRFFREGAWSNAYVEVGQMVWDVLRRAG